MTESLDESSLGAAMTSPLVSVLTAVRNGERFISEAIESVRGQTLGDWEHVVVDDASTDGTLELVESWARRDPRVRLVKRERSGGPYRAANTGLEVCRGAYIARLDADDLALPERLERQVAFLEGSPSLRACGSHHQTLRASGELGVAHRWSPSRPGVMKWWLCAAGGPAHSTAFLQRSAFEELGGYRELDLAADRWLWSVLARNGWLGVVPEVLTLRRQHERQLGVTDVEPQLAAGLEIAHGHIEALSGKSWPVAEVRALHDVAHRRTTPAMPAAKALGRFTWAWLRDPDLALADRRQIARMTARWWARLARTRATRAPNRWRSS